MTFFRTEMLFFIWVVPVLFLVIVYGMRRRREIMNRFASPHGLMAIVPDRVDGRRWIKGSLLMGTVLFTAVALAGPKYGFRWQEIRQRGVDIIIALDCSRSMTATDIQPTRLERAKREAFDLLDESAQSHRHVAVKLNAKKLLAVLARHSWVLAAGPWDPFPPCRQPAAEW